MKNGNETEFKIIHNKDFSRLDCVVIKRKYINILPSVENYGIFC